nr:MAG TPA: hypothetical protein [Caudoviricetes sp.]
MTPFRFKGFSPTHLRPTSIVILYHILYQMSSPFIKII